MLRATPIRIVLLCALLAGAALALPQPAQASAGYELCVKVMGGLCKRCMDVGYYTGACCIDIGLCGCIYTVCPYSTGASTGGMTAEGFPFAAELAPDATETPAGPAPRSAPEAPAADSDPPATEGALAAAAAPAAD